MNKIKKHMIFNTKALIPKKLNLKKRTRILFKRKVFNLQVHKKSKIFPLCLDMEIKILQILKLNPYKIIRRKKLNLFKFNPI